MTDLHYNARDMAWEKPKDQRCNCDDIECPICGPELLNEIKAKVHRPWEPKAGEIPDPLEVENERLAGVIDQYRMALHETRVTWLQRYAFVMLSSILGGSIGGFVALYAFNT